jgi:hypothetical protein
MTRMVYAQHFRMVAPTKMKMPALTGISRKVYEILFERPLLSLEIKSADNIIALLNSGKGDHIFLTPILRDDLFCKGDGIICELVEKNVGLQKVKKWDEVEIVTVRIQVKPLCMGRIRGMEKDVLGSGVTVEVERVLRGPIS